MRKIMRAVSVLCIFNFVISIYVIAAGTVTYHGNGNTGGTVPVDTNSYATGDKVKVFDNTGGLSKEGYAFGGWNTQADGKGISYDVNYYKNSGFTMGNENINLYAKWDVWNPLPTSPPDITKGSILDLSFMNDAPAGKHGFIKIDQNGDYYFENEPNKKVKFYGTNLTGNAILDCNKLEAEKIADRLAATGYNVVRLHCADSIETWVQGIFEKPTSTTVTLEENKLDNLEYLIAKFKERGIYITIDILTYIPFDNIPSLSGYNVPTGCLAVFFPDAMAAWKSMAYKWLTHENPYTGLALKDDPVLIGVAPWNESIIYNTQITGQSMKTYIIEDFNRFLALKGKAPITALADSFYSEPPTVADSLIEYYSEKTISAYNEMKDYLVNQVGIMAPIGGLNMLDNAVQNLWRTNADVHETHLYNGYLNGSPESSFSFYPDLFPRLTDVFDPEVKSKYSSLSNSNMYEYYLPGLALRQLYNKPFMLSEYNQEFPTKGREELGAMMAAMGAYNGWDMLNRYTWGSFVPQIVYGAILGGTSGGATFSISNDNLAVLSEIQGSLVFRKSNLTESSPRFVIVRDKTWAKSDDSALFNIYREQNMMYLTHLFKTVIVYADKPGEPTAIYKITPELTSNDISTGNIPSQNKIGNISSDMTLKDVALTFINSLDDADLKNRMLSEIDTNKLVSDTGELTYDLNMNTYLLSTPYTVGSIGTLNGNTFSLGKASLNANVEKGTMLASSLDNNPLDESGKILITYTTDAAATNDSFMQDTTDSNKLIYTRGTLPTLIKYNTAEFKLTTKRNIKTFEAYKLDMSGNRVERIPIDISGNTISVQLETDKGFAFELINTSAGILSLNLSVEDGVWSVKGHSYPDSYTTLLIKDWNDQINYVNQIKSDIDGFYEFNALLPKSNSYYVKVGGDGFDEPLKETVGNHLFVNDIIIRSSAGENGEITITASTELYNHNPDAKTACIVLAVYEDNKLIDVSSKKSEPVLSGGYADLSLDYNYSTTDKKYTFKAFVWEDINTMKPISDAVVK